MNLGNYTVHALHSLLNLQARKDISGADKAALGHYELLLRESQPFLLPENGFLMDRDAERYVPVLWQLPYPVTSFEFTCTLPPENGTVAATKRLFVCYEATKSTGLDCLSPKQSEGVLFCCLLFVREDLSETWVPIAHALICPQESLSPRNRADLSHMMHGTVHRNSFFCVPLPTVPSVMKRIVDNIGHDGWCRATADDISYEFEVVSQVLCWLELKNSLVRQIEPSASLNKKRISSGKLPFLTYKILDLKPIAGEKHDNSFFGSVSQGRRLHRRRAHRRKHGDGFIGVRAHWVGNPNNGAVVKDYRIRNLQAQEATP